MNKSIEQFQGDCSSLTLQQLILVKSKLSSEISIIQTQLDMPHDYHTLPWKLRARAAIRHKQVELSYVTDLVTHYECTKYLDFYNQARHLLDPDTFNVIQRHVRKS